MRDATGTRQKIQAAALHLFVEKGVAQTSVRDLAQAAGMAEGTLYRHYVSKDALITELFATNYAAFARTLDDLQRGRIGFRAKLDAMVEGFCHFFDETPLLFRFLLLVQHEVLPGVADDGDNPVTVLRATVAAAIEAGEITARDADMATAMTMGLVLQPAVFLVYGRIDPPFARHAGTIADACWRALNP